MKKEFYDNVASKKKQYHGVLRAVCANNATMQHAIHCTRKGIKHLTFHISASCRPVQP